MQQIRNLVAFRSYICLSYGIFTKVVYQLIKALNVNKGFVFTIHFNKLALLHIHKFLVISYELKKCAQLEPSLLEQSLKECTRPQRLNLAKWIMLKSSRNILLI